MKVAGFKTFLDRITTHFLLFFYRSSCFFSIFAKFSIHWKIPFSLQEKCLSVSPQIPQVWSDLRNEPNSSVVFLLVPAVSRLIFFPPEMTTASRKPACTLYIDPIFVDYFITPWFPPCFPVENPRLDALTHPCKELSYLPSFNATLNFDPVAVRYFRTIQSRPAMVSAPLPSSSCRDFPGEAANEDSLEPSKPSVCPIPSIFFCPPKQRTRSAKKKGLCSHKLAHRMVLRSDDSARDVWWFFILSSQESFSDTLAVLMRPQIFNCLVVCSGWARISQSELPYCISV